MVDVWCYILKRKFNELIKIESDPDPAYLTWKGPRRPPMTFYDKELLGGMLNSIFSLLIEIYVTKFKVKRA